MPSQPSSPTTTGKACLLQAVPAQEVLHAGPYAGLMLPSSFFTSTFVLHLEKTDPEMEASVWPITPPPLM